MRNIIVIDNYDSFVYNLCDYVGTMKKTEIEVYRNDRITVREVLDKNPDLVIISPGPGRPENAGVSMELIEKAQKKVPVLGVCLGHQCLAAVYGAGVVKSKNIMHGKTSRIFYDEKEKIFNGINNPFAATRYHSLIVDPESVGKNLKVIARTEKNEIMGIKHTRFAQYGLQFHPESILTDSGYKLLKNTLNMLTKKNDRIK
ncbi:MAG: anthranilate synthase component II [Elusimicrobiota bacterium]